MPSSPQHPRTVGRCRAVPSVSRARRTRTRTAEGEMPQRDRCSQQGRRSIRGVQKVSQALQKGQTRPEGKEASEHALFRLRLFHTLLTGRHRSSAIFICRRPAFDMRHRLFFPRRDALMTPPFRRHHQQSPVCRSDEKLLAAKHEMKCRHAMPGGGRMPARKNVRATSATRKALSR